MVEKRLCDLNRLRWIICDREGIPYDCFLAFVDAKGETADAAAFQSNKAGQDAGVEILEQELGGALVSSSGSR